MSRWAVLVALASSLLVACHSSAADERAKAKAACSAEKGQIGNPAATRLAKSAGPSWVKLADEAEAAQAAASRSATAEDIGPILEKLAADCEQLGITIGRPIGGS